MAQTIKLKRSNTAGNLPTTSDLALGEVAINTKDGKFKISSEMMNLLGCSKENFYKVMQLMDYKREKKDEDIFFYKGSKKINKVKFFKRKNSPFQKLSSLYLK